MWDKRLGHVKLQLSPILIKFWGNFKLNRHITCHSQVIGTDFTNLSLIFGIKAKNKAL